MLTSELGSFAHSILTLGLGTQRQLESLLLRHQTSHKLVLFGVGGRDLCPLPANDLCRQLSYAQHPSLLCNSSYQLASKPRHSPAQHHCALLAAPLRLFSHRYRSRRRSAALHVLCRDCLALCRNLCSCSAVRLPRTTQGPLLLLCFQLSRAIQAHLPLLRLLSATHHAGTFAPTPLIECHASHRDLCSCSAYGRSRGGCRCCLVVIFGLGVDAKELTEPLLCHHT